MIGAEQRLGLVVILTIGVAPPHLSSGGWQ